MREPPIKILILRIFCQNNYYYDIKCAKILEFHEKSHMRNFIGGWGYVLYGRVHAHTEQYRVGKLTTDESGAINGAKNEWVPLMMSATNTTTTVHHL